MLREAADWRRPTPNLGMDSSSYVRPRAPVEYVAYRAPRNPEAVGYGALTSARRADFKHLGFREFRDAGALTSVVRPMEKPVSLVLFRRLPFQVVAVAAALMAFSTRVRSLVPGSWRGAMLAFANYAGNDVRFAVDPNLPIALAGRRERPNQALVAIKIGHDLIQKSGKLTEVSPPTERVPMLAKTPIMRIAPAPSPTGLAAPIDRACSLRLSHFCPMSLKDRRKRRLDAAQDFAFARWEVFDGHARDPASVSLKRTDFRPFWSIYSARPESISARHVEGRNGACSPCASM